MKLYLVLIKTLGVCVKQIDKVVHSTNRMDLDLRLDYT